MGFNEEFTLQPECYTALDQQDPLARFRNEFWIPGKPDGTREVYFVGNSLGLQPKRTEEFVGRELQQWKELGVRGHFEGEFPWMPYHEFLTSPMAEIVGGWDSEVVVMNSLTANLHLMLASFYQPLGDRRKILMEAQAFPSDYQAVVSQIQWHGLSPDESLIQLAPPPGSSLLSTEQVVDEIRKNGDELALVLLPGVQYYSGQLFDIPTITQECHRHGVVAGFDLAHAAGNVELKLHDWNVDFAVWCSYKYLNSGPGSVAGCFIHQRHATDVERLRLAGWWGHDKSTRFLMKNQFHPIATAEGWQLSNPPILSLAAIRASLDVFQEAGFANLVAKSKRLTAYLEYLILHRLAGQVKILTPKDPAQRGCQLSLAVQGEYGKSVYESLESQGIRTDWREPNGIRCAPVPLYNTFQDCWEFVEGLFEALNAQDKSNTA